MGKVVLRFAIVKQILWPIHNNSVAMLADDEVMTLLEGNAVVESF